MLFKHVHHVHYVVKNRDAMIEYLEKNFEMKPKEVCVNTKAQTKDALYIIGPNQMQISEPMDPASNIGRHLATQGPGVFHVAWAVDNVPKVAQDLETKGNKLRGEKAGVTVSGRGYHTCNIEPASSQGVWFQLADGEAGG